MTDEGTPQTNPSLTDEEILKRADMINEARKLEQEEKQRQIEEEKARQAAEAERIRKEQEAQKAAELKRAHELVDAEKAAQPKKKKHTGAKIVLAIVVILIILCGLAVVSYSVTSVPVSSATPLPNTAYYTVWLPQGTTTIAGIDISLLGDATKLMVTMPGKATETLRQGDKIVVGPYMATLSLLWGAWKVYDITGSAELTYKGISTDNLITFDATVHTDKPIPTFLFNTFMSIAGIKYAAA